MTQPHEHEEKDVAPENRKSSDSKAADDSASPSKAVLMRLMLKRIASYAILGFAPAVAVLALVIAVVAVTGNQPSQPIQTQLNKATATIDSLSASLSASRDELEKLKASVAHEKTRQEERTTKIVQSVSELQVIIHISPTLEEELHQPARTSAVSPPVAAPPVASTVAAPAAKAVLAGADKKPGIRAQDMKEALEKFNQKQPAR